MPSTVVHKYTEDRPEKLIQLSSSFTVSPDGYITVPLEFMITLKGLQDERVKKALIPKPGQEFPQEFYKIKNLPPNRGLFVQSATMSYQNGIHIARLQCTSCLRQGQSIVDAQTSTKTFAAASQDEQQGPDGEKEIVTLYFSFQAKIPTISVSTCCLATEKPAFNSSVTITGEKLRRAYTYLNLIVNGSRGFQYSFIPYNIIGTRGFKKSENNWAITESESRENDGSVVRTTKTYTVELI